MFGSSPTPALVPNTKIVPTRARFSCYGTFPAAQHTECAHMGTFFVLGCLPALTCPLTTPRTRKTRDVSRVFRVWRHPCPLLPFPCSPPSLPSHLTHPLLGACFP